MNCRNVRACVLAALLSVSGALTQITQAAEDAPPAVSAMPWLLRVPADQKVEFRAFTNADEGGGSAGSMLYPAPSVAGFIAAVITHGVISESTKRAEKERMQSAADRTLEPFQAIIATLSPREVFQRANAKLPATPPHDLTDATTAPLGGLLIVAKPQFAFSRDQSALILDNEITISHHKERSLPAKKYNVRVVSSPRAETDMVAYWNANKGEVLQEQAAALLADSIGIALNDSAPAAGAFRTVRYLEGRAEKIERARVITESTERIVMVNLRGVTMAVPPRPQEAAVPTEADRPAPAAVTKAD